MDATEIELRQRIAHLELRVSQLVHIAEAQADATMSIMYRSVTTCSQCNDDLRQRIELGCTYPDCHNGLCPQQ